jgi:hypothetical protein
MSGRSAAMERSEDNGKGNGGRRRLAIGINLPPMLLGTASAIKKKGCVWWVVLGSRPVHKDCDTTLFRLAPKLPKLVNYEKESSDDATGRLQLVALKIRLVASWPAGAETFCLLLALSLCCKDHPHLPFTIHCVFDSVDLGIPSLAPLHLKMPSNYPHNGNKGNTPNRKRKL